MLNPMDVPVYLWEKGAPVLTPLTNFKRTPLKTYYLQKNYGGNNEPWMHLVDETYDYGPSSVGVRQRDAKSDVWGKRKAEIERRKAEGGNRKDYDNAILEGKPKSYLLSQNYPNPFNPKTFIEYTIPKDGHVRIEVYNQNGQIVDILVDGWQKQGIHLVSWNAERKASGIYFYRFKTDGFQEARKMVLVR